MRLCVIISYTVRLRELYVVLWSSRATNTSYKINGAYSQQAATVRHAALTLSAAGNSCSPKQTLTYET
jgi:hypothetical protein